MGGAVNVHGVDLIESGDMVCLAHRHEPFEPRSVEAWCDWLAGGGIAVDVGAYTGLYTKLALQRGCLVFAFEPNPVALARLRENVGDHPGLWSSGYALAHTEGRAALVGGAPLSSAHRIEMGGTDVPCTTLDAALPFTSPDRVALKIDAEGMDGAILRGAELFIGNNRPLVLVEAIAPSAEVAVRALLPAYTVERVDDRNLLCAPLS